MSFTIRTRTEADDDAVAQVHRLAFDSDAHGRLPAAIQASGHARPGWSWVAERDGSVIGHAMASTTFLDLDDGGTAEVPMLSPIGVVPDDQGSGVGSGLVRSVVAAVDADGEPFLLLEGDPRYYARFGFQDARTHGVRFDLPDWAPPEAGQLRPLRAYRRLPGRVRYPQSFTDAVGD